MGIPTKIFIYSSSKNNKNHSEKSSRISGQDRNKLCFVNSKYFYELAKRILVKIASLL